MKVNMDALSERVKSEINTCRLEHETPFFFMETVYDNDKNTHSTYIWPPPR